MAEVVRLAPVLPNEENLLWQAEKTAWLAWGERRFPDLARNLAACWQAAAARDLPELVATARAGMARWSEREQTRSLLAGKELLECVQGARGHEAYLKLRDRWLSSGEPSPYQAVLAARAAFLHQPLVILFTACAWREWRANQDAIRAGGELASLGELDAAGGLALAGWIARELRGWEPQRVRVGMRRRVLTRVDERRGGQEG